MLPGLRYQGLPVTAWVTFPAKETARSDGPKHKSDPCTQAFPSTPGLSRCEFKLTHKRLGSGRGCKQWQKPHQILLSFQRQSSSPGKPHTAATTQVPQSRTSTLTSLLLSPLPQSLAAHPEPSLAWQSAPEPEGSQAAQTCSLYTS